MHKFLGKLYLPIFVITADYQKERVHKMTLIGKPSGMFTQALAAHMIANGIIADNDKIETMPIHIKEFSGKKLWHHIIQVEGKSTRYFLRTIKEKDFSYCIVNELANLNNSLGYHCFPQAVLPPFEINSQAYILTTFLEGSDLESLMTYLTDDDLRVYGIQLSHRLQSLHSVVRSRYSESSKEDHSNFGKVTSEKLIRKLLGEPLLKWFTSSVSIDRLVSNINVILKRSTYSAPALIHLDVKPGNIVIPENGTELCLIDFELARFGDLDYEWTNILVKGLLNYDERFKKYVLGQVINDNFMSLDEALHIEKYRVYLLYHSINNYIYFASRNALCPMPVVELIKQLLREIECEGD